MFWQEEVKQAEFIMPDGVQDCVFGISAKTLPVDHLGAVAKALLVYFPWLEVENASIHDINITDGNGWFVPKSNNALFYPSRRSKLVIRVPKNRMKSMQSLVGKKLNCNGHSLGIIKQYPSKKLSDSTTIFARYLDNSGMTNEDEFLNKYHQLLLNLGIKPKKMMAGLNHTITTNNRTISTRSMMLADLNKEHSYQLQAYGLGNHRLLGCGLFLPQKGIDSVAAV